MDNNECMPPRAIEKVKHNFLWAADQSIWEGNLFLRNSKPDSFLQPIYPGLIDQVSDFKREQKGAPRSLGHGDNRRRGKQ